MKKYKLIKKYPGSTEVGEIVQGNGREGWYTKGPGCRTYDWTQIVYYPEYWEEVIEKDYEILSYIKKGSTTCTTTKRRGGENHEEFWNIHSVKRLSDREVFTVGDRITGQSYTDARVIEKIRIRYDGSIELEQKHGDTRLAYATKVKNPIFLTHDGKDIFPEDTVWYVNKENFYHDYITAYPEVKFNSEIRAYFLTEEAAVDYINKNKPRLSTEDCFRILQNWHLYGLGFKESIEKYVRENNK